MDGQFRSFQQRGPARPEPAGIGSIGMKSLGGNGKIVTEAVVSIEEALRYVFSLPIATLVSGIDSEKVLDQNLKIVRDFKPMTAEETARRSKPRCDRSRRRSVRAVQDLEVFDGPYHRKQHGFSTEIS